MFTQCVAGWVSYILRFSQIQNAAKKQSCNYIQSAYWLNQDILYNEPV